MIWNNIISEIFPWTKSLSMICFSEDSDLMTGQAVRGPYLDAFILYY